MDSEPSLGEQNGAVEEIFASVMAAAEGGDAAAQQQLGVLYHRGACDGGRGSRQGGRESFTALSFSSVFSRVNLPGMAYGGGAVVRRWVTLVRDALS